MKKIFISILLLLIFNLNAEHGSKDSKGYKDEGWIIKTLTSAAPSFIGDHATVISPSGEVLREGTNGWTCLAFVAMPKMGYKSKQDAAPACADANAMAWADAYMSQTTPKLTKHTSVHQNATAQPTKYQNISIFLHWEKYRCKYAVKHRRNIFLPENKYNFD